MFGIFSTFFTVSKNYSFNNLLPSTIYTTKNIDLFILVFYPILRDFFPDDGRDCSLLRLILAVASGKLNLT